MHSFSPAPTTSSVREERILMALTEQERGLFFPEVALDGILDRPLKKADPRSLGTDGWENLLREYRPTVLVTAWNTPKLPVTWTEEPDLSLRYICHVTGAVRFFIPRPLLLRGVAVTNWGGLASLSVAEHGLLLGLAALRNLAGWQETIRTAREPGAPNATARLGTRSLFGRHVGIHGFGQVARSLVKLLQPFDVTLHVFSEGVPHALMREAGATPCASLTELFARSEVLFECEALTPLTAGSVTAAVLAALPDQAVLVNVARGALIDETALHREARSGRIRIALDVVTHEPLAPGEPLLSVEDGVFSPHISGPTQDWFPRCGQHAIANLFRYLNREPLEAVVTPEIYDRST